jgi:hypothetical protein
MVARDNSADFIPCGMSACSILYSTGWLDNELICSEYEFGGDTRAGDWMCLREQSPASAVLHVEYLAWWDRIDRWP